MSEQLTVVVCVAFDHRSPTLELKKFKECIYSSPLVETALEVSGSFDLILHAQFESLAHYNDTLDLIADQLRIFVTKVEANFVGKKIDRRHSTGTALWLPVRDGRRRVSTNLIDKIVAQGDYMEVHVGDWNCLVHQTIRHIYGQLDHEQFIQIHRSVIVRADFIERMLHQNRRWIARLRDGTEHAVAKSHVAEIIRLMDVGSASNGAGSAKDLRATDNSRQMNENHLHLAL